MQLTEVHVLLTINVLYAVTRPQDVPVLDSGGGHWTHWPASIHLPQVSSLLAGVLVL